MGPVPVVARTALLAVAVAMLVADAGRPDVAAAAAGGRGPRVVAARVTPVDAALVPRPEVLISGTADPAGPTARPRPDPLVPAASWALVAFGFAVVHRARPGPGPLGWRRSGVRLRAPPLLPVS
jgi:hypothetical protein